MFAHNLCTSTLVEHAILPVKSKVVKRARNWLSKTSSGSVKSKVCVRQAIDINMTFDLSKFTIPTSSKDFWYLSYPLKMLRVICMIHCFHFCTSHLSKSPCWTRFRLQNLICVEGARINMVILRHSCPPHCLYSNLPHTVAPCPNIWVNLWRAAKAHRFPIEPAIAKTGWS